MRAFWYFAHIAGYSIWIGAALAAMVLGIASKREPANASGTASRLHMSLYPTLIGPGAILSLVSGLFLTLQLYNRVTAVGLSQWLMAMQGLGLLASLIVIVFALPAASKLSRLDPERDPDLYPPLKKRLVLVGMGSGILAMLALLTGALYRYG
jgi:hypothetical protein